MGGATSPSGPGLLPGLQSQGPDHRRAAQPGRQHRQLDHRSGSCARPGSTGASASGKPRRGTCSTPFAATSSCSATSARRRTGRPSRRRQAVWVSGQALIGTRTWGGEIWLTSSNVLVDRGIATAGEFGVYGPEGDWLIEGTVWIPTSSWTTCPTRRFDGKDAQLEAAIGFLQRKIEDEPVEDWVVPEHPDKSFRY